MKAITKDQAFKLIDSVGCVPNPFKGTNKPEDVELKLSDGRNLIMRFKSVDWHLDTNISSVNWYLK